MCTCTYIYYVDLHDSAQGNNHNNICMQLYNVESSSMLPKFTGFKADIHNKLNVNMQPFDYVHQP